MRLFVACPVTAEIASYLSTIQSAISHAELTKTKAFHLTLKFLGDVDESKVDAIKEQLQQIKFQPFEATLAQVGVFPDKQRPRVVWVGLEPADKIHTLQNQVATALKGLFPTDDRFHPHLTLARIKQPEPGFAEALDKIVVELKQFPVDKLVLFQSELNPTGPVYTELLTVSGS